MNWVKLDPPVTARDDARLPNLPVGALVFTTQWLDDDKPEVFLIGDCVSAHSDAGCGCCSHSYTVHAYCLDLVGMIEGVEPPW